MPYISGQGHKEQQTGNGLFQNGLLQEEQTMLSEHVIYCRGVRLEGVHNDSNLSNLKYFILQILGEMHNSVTR